MSIKCDKCKEEIKDTDLDKFIDEDETICGECLAAFIRGCFGPWV